MKGKFTFLLSLGSIITLISGLLAAFIPRLAYVTIYTFSEFPLEMPTPLARYSPLEFSFHTATLGLLLASAGSLATLLSQIATDKKRLNLSSAGISLGIIGLLLSAWPRTEQPTLSISYHYVQMPWVGTIVTMMGISIMFVGFAAKSRVSRISLLSVPILLMLYLATPIMIVSNSLLLLAPAGEKAIFVGILLLAGHMLMLVGVFKGILRRT